MSSDMHDLLSRMADELDNYRQLLTDDRREVHALAAEARAALDAAPEGEGPVLGTRRVAIWNPTQMAECDGPCWEARDPSACDCGALWVDVPAFPATPLEGDSVPVPLNADMAAGMVLLGDAYLREHAPERLRPAAPLKPVAYIHRQGKYWEVSERLLRDDERARGWTEEPLYAAPPAPLEGEVGELVAKLRRLAPQNPLGSADPTILRAADLLEQLSAPAPAMVPVPVSERLPGEGDCDAEGRVWVGHWNDVDGDAVFSWELDRPSGYTWKGISTMVAWLPGYALPLPAPQGGEGEG